MIARAVIITGAASPVGAAVARRFADAGDRLVLTDEDEPAGRALAARLNESAAIFVAADLGARLDVHNLVAEALETFGRIDVLVCTPEEPQSAGFLDLTEDAFDAALARHLKSVFLLNQAAARQMMRQADGGGFIVNIVAARAQGGGAGYAAAQGGVRALTEASGPAFAECGVRVRALLLDALGPQAAAEEAFQLSR